MKERSEEITHKTMSAIKNKDTGPKVFSEKLYGNLVFDTEKM